MAIPGALGEYALGESESLGDSIRPSGIASDAAFGLPTVTADAYELTVTGIASAEAFGSPIVQESAIFPDGIASAAAFGVPSVIIVIAPPGIASAAAFGSPGVWELVYYNPVSRV